MPNRGARIQPSLSSFPAASRRNSRARKGRRLNTRFIPITRTSIPETRVMILVAELPRKRMPPPKMMARRTKTTENPATNSNVLPKSLPRASLFSETDSTDSPEMNERYTGMSGRTQGLRNDKSPAANESATDGSWPIISPSPGTRSRVFHYRIRMIPLFPR